MGATACLNKRKPRLVAPLAVATPPYHAAMAEPRAIPESRSPEETRPRRTGKPGPILELARDIKISHSVFALPYALLAAFMSHPTPDAGWGRFAGQLALISGCMVAARTVAMLANRLIDRDLDRLNPRTAGRALPSRRVRAQDAVAILLTFAFLFIALCATFGFAFDNWWPFLLSVPVLLWIGAYGYLKRFSWLCHLYLGSSLAISPLAAAIAIEPSALFQQPALWLLSLTVITWVAGFDIIYALQDLEVDRQQGLHSMPARFGTQRALWISRGLHVVSFLSLAAILVVDPRFGTLFGVGVVIVAALLILEHRITAGGSTKSIQFAFLTLNGIVSVVVGILGVISLFA